MTGGIKMQIVKFNAKCPFEIGDFVYCAPQDSVGRCEKHKITDILTIFRAKNGTVAFMYELDGNGKYVRIADGAINEKQE